MQAEEHLVAIAFVLRLEERRADRVFVSVLLAPEGDPVGIEGVSVQIFSTTREPMSSRLLLPIQGQLQQPMVSTVELRATNHVLHPGARVVGVVWWADGQIEATCSTDLSTEFEAHVLGRRAIPLNSESTAELRWLYPEEREIIAKTMAWIDTPLVPEDLLDDNVLEEEEDQEDFISQLRDELGLDEEDAMWVQQLMEEDD